MISNVSNRYAVSAYSAASGVKPQTGAGAAPETQQLASPASNSNSDKVSISQAGKALAANENKPPVDITDAKAVAKEDLAQQKLAYEQKQGATTVLPNAASSQDSAKAGAEKPPVDITDAKAVAKEHLAQQKLADEQKLAVTAAEASNASKQQIGAIASYQNIQSLHG